MTEKAIKEIESSPRKMIEEKMFQDVHKRRFNTCLPNSSFNLRRDLNRNLRKINEKCGVSTCQRNIKIHLKKLHKTVLKKLIKDLQEDNNVLNKNKLKFQQNKVFMNKTTNNNLLEREQTIQQIFQERTNNDPMENEDIKLQVEAVRKEFNKNDYKDVDNSIFKNTTKLKPALESEGINILCIVIDTSIFLSNLKLVEEVLDTNFRSSSLTAIIIPYIVICELYYLRHHTFEHVRIRAIEAVNCINKHIYHEHPRLVLQTPAQAAKCKETFFVECPDDGVLQCCLAIHQLNQFAVLLSYNKYLCTKAMLFDIVALGREAPLEIIDYYYTIDRVSNEEFRLSDKVYQDAKIVMKDFLSGIIAEQFLDIYGIEWQQYVYIESPGTVVTAFQCIIEYWVAIMNKSFQSNVSIHILKELLAVFEQLTTGNRKLQKMNHILEKCSILIQTVNANKHHDIMTRSLNKITDLKERCCEYILNISKRRLYTGLAIVHDI